MMNTKVPIAAEFIIYTFDKSKYGNRAKFFEWKRHGIYQNQVDAITQGKSLFESKKFERVEIKKKFFDSQKNRQIDKTLKVFKPSLLSKIFRILGIFYYKIFTKRSILFYSRKPNLTLTP